MTGNETCNCDVCSVCAMRILEECAENTRLLAAIATNERG